MDHNIINSEDVFSNDSEVGKFRRVNYTDRRSIEYYDFLEKLKIEFGHFLTFAESARTNRNIALKARKKSIELRKMLKQFRVISIENDRRIDKIMKEARKQIEEERG